MTKQKLPMAKYEFQYFDEKGVVHAKKGKIAVDEWIHCGDPVRFVGGGCGRYFTCSRANGKTCLAKPTKAAQEKKDQADEDDAGEIDGAEIAAQFREKCPCCGELIEDSEYPEDNWRVADEGTGYTGKKICRSCYDDDLSEPCAVIEYCKGDGTELAPDGHARIGCVQNETEGEFTVKYTSTDAWRGYYSMVSDKYVKVFDDCILSGHESEAMLKELSDFVLKRFDEEGIHYARCFPRTSNLFACGFEIWVQKDVDQILKAEMIISGAKMIVDFDNELYKTGILIDREALAKLKGLLKGKYQLNTDNDLWKAVGEKGETFVKDVMEVCGG
jgi:hypothetical protein